MRKFCAGVLCAWTLLIWSAIAPAHFQLVYTPEVNIDKPGDLPFKLIFWHPMSNGHVMGMGDPEELFVLFKGERTDLKGTLEPVTFHGAGNQAKGYDANARIKRNGDYIVVVVPAPYYEESEDKFIQQIAKSYVNKGGVPTGWQESVGLPTEIVPLNKPYGVLAGSTFSGKVLSAGKPVAGAEIEIEYMAAEPDMAANKPQPPTAEPIPGGAIVAITDAGGVFTFGIPRAGFWGFAALEVGPATEHRGKPLSQDAVIWIRAHALK